VGVRPCALERDVVAQRDEEAGVLSAHDARQLCHLRQAAETSPPCASSTPCCARPLRRDMQKDVPFANADETHVSMWTHVQTAHCDMRLDIRRTVSTSPFFMELVATRWNTSAPSSTLADATASRCVASFCGG
jgi:hypothetical protein